MPNSPDVAGMVNDPQFLGLSPSDQRAALGKLTGDDTFGGLSDGDTMSFVSRMKRPPVGPPVQMPVPPELQNTPTDEQSQTRQMLVSGLTGMPTPNMTALDRTNFATGKAAGAASVPMVAGAVSGAANIPLAVNAGAEALTPHVLRMGQWAVEHPIAAKALYTVVKDSALGGGALYLLKKGLDIGLAGK